MSSYSAKNSLKVFVSPYKTPSSQLTPNALLTGEIGFYDTSGDIATSGDGYFYWKKSDGSVKKSCLITSFTGWSAVDSYAAPTMRSTTVTIATNTVGQVYQLRLDMKLVGMQGEYFKHGNYMAVSGDTTTDIATGLVTAINASLLREGKDSYFTITSSSAVITITQVLQPYIKAKKQGRPIDFKASLSLPYVDGVLEEESVAGSDGVGYGPYVAEKEMFAQGDSDSFRFNGWPNSFDFDALETSATGQYNVLTIVQNNDVQSQMDKVNAPQEYMICFDQADTSIETDITAFVLAEQTGAATINTSAHTVAIEVANGTTVTGLEPDVAVSAGATVSPLTGVVTNFTSAVNYTVTAEDGSTSQVWVVTVSVAS